MLTRSIDEARDAFGELARLEPKLWSLWELCRIAAPADGWCAEDVFIEHVKPTLMVLIGMYRKSGPEELQTTTSYELAYDLLLSWALLRTCACCTGHGALDDDAHLEDRDG